MLLAKNLYLKQIFDPSWLSGGDLKRVPRTLESDFCGSETKLLQVSASWLFNIPSTDHTGCGFFSEN